MDKKAINKALHAIKILPSYTRLSNSIWDFEKEFDILIGEKKTITSSKFEGNIVKYPDNKHLRTTLGLDYDEDYIFITTDFSDEVDMLSAEEQHLESEKCFKDIFDNNRQIFEFIKQWAIDNNRLLEDIKLSSHHAILKPTKKEIIDFNDKKAIALANIDEKFNDFNTRLQVVVDEIDSEFNLAKSSGALAAHHKLFNQIKKCTPDTFLQQFPSPTKEELDIFMKTR